LCNNPRTKVKIVYPAKLIQDGTVIRDELPEWGQYVGANRLSKLGQIDHVENQYVRKPTDTVPSNDSNTQNMSTQPHVENDVSVFMQPRPVHMHHSVPVPTQVPVANSIQSEIISPATFVPPSTSNQTTIPGSSSVDPASSQDICTTNTTSHLDNHSTCTSSVGTTAMGIKCINHKVHVVQENDRITQHKWFTTECYDKRCLFNRMLNINRNSKSEENRINMVKAGTEYKSLILDVD